jgi:FkbM family methyltransferase
MQQTEAMLEAQLDELLSEDIRSVKERERSAFDTEVAPFGDAIVLFGVGNIGRKILGQLRQDGVEPLAFSDNNRAAWGTTIEGLPVLPPEEAVRRYGKSAAFLVSIYNFKHNFVDTRRQLQDLGCEKVLSVLPLRWKYHESFLPHFRDDLPHKVYSHADAIRAAFRLWADDFSRREFLAQVRFRTHGDLDTMAPPAGHDSYFQEDFLPLGPQDVIVDCGAFDGDTLRSFLRCRGSAFRKYFTLEPDPDNCRLLADFTATLPGEVRDKIIIRPVAVGATRGRVRFEAGAKETSAISEMGSIEVDCIPLDELLEGEPPTYIKMDIEGAELDAITGARRLIHDHSPAFAACVYHQQDHLWRIPLTLHEANPGYRLYLRPYLFEGWDLICYAVPAERAITC